MNYLKPLFDRIARNRLRRELEAMTYYQRKDIGATDINDYVNRAFPKGN